MRKSTKIRPPVPKSPTATAASDKKRMIAMGVALLLVVIAFGYARFQESRLRSEEAQFPAPDEVVNERVEVPTVDVAKLEEIISDGEAEDRVLLEREALDELMPIARNLTAAHFDAMESTLIDGAVVESLLADPAENRGKAFTARGWITALRWRNPGGGRPKEAHGRLVIESGETVYFVAAYAPDSLTTDEYGRIDGLLLKAFNDEDPDEPGSWVQGPLLVSPELQRSYSPLGEVAELREGDFADVTDDDLEIGISGIPRREYWRLLSFADHPASDELDWESAPEIEQRHVDEMLRDGAKWRAQPFRMPPTKLMGIWTAKPGENPGRFEEITEGWIGSWTWTGETKVVRFSAPRPRPDLKEGDLVTGRGFFLKNLAYEPSQGAMSVASLVVMDDLERFIPPDDESVDQVWVGVVTGAVGFGLLIPYLLLRDRRRSKELYGKLAERRRKRRTTGPIEEEGAASAPPA